LGRLRESWAAFRRLCGLFPGLPSPPFSLETPGKQRQKGGPTRGRGRKMGVSALFVNVFVPLAPEVREENGSRLRSLCSLCARFAAGFPRPSRHGNPIRQTGAAAAPRLHGFFSGEGFFNVRGKVRKGACYDAAPPLGNVLDEKGGDALPRRACPTDHGVVSVLSGALSGVGSASFLLFFVNSSSVTSAAALAASELQRDQSL